MNTLILSPATNPKGFTCLGAYQSMGCPGCGGKCGSSLSGAADYDTITIGGKQYSAGQIVDKTIIANRDVVLYPSLFNDTGKFTVKAGQSIGKVFSYLLPSSRSNPTGKVVLQFERGYNVYYWLKDDNAVNTQALKDQGAVTLAEQLKQEEEEKKREADPLGYYLGKYGMKAILIGGGIYLAATFGKEFLKNKMSKAQ